MGAVLLTIGILLRIKGENADSWWTILLLISGPAIIVLGFAGGLTGGLTKK